MSVLKTQAIENEIAVLKRERENYHNNFSSDCPHILSLLKYSTVSELTEPMYDGLLKKVEVFNNNINVHFYSEVSQADI